MTATPTPTFSPHAADWRLAVDIGGTFTDLVLLDAASGTVVVEKTLTTPTAPLDGVRTGVRSLLDKAGIRPAEIVAPIVHATTLITNALIEGKIGRAGVVTTAGFGDTLEIRDEHRYDMYDLQIEFPAPPVPHERVVEIAERTNAVGQVILAPMAEGLAAITEQLRAQRVEAVGICLINSYANAANEKVIAEHLRRELKVPVCISSDISPQIREYPRMITTACNAATMPVIGPYLDELQKWLASEGFGGSVLMMLSNGGVVAADDAAQAPIRLVESGPAAGALAGSWFAQRLGEERLLCFDMGGTTAKSCLIIDGEPELTNTFEVARIYRFKKGSGFPVSVPSVDLVEIGAGGGSLARLDELGLLKVGPESAGADPGPACYGRGGSARRSPTPISNWACSTPSTSSAATCRSISPRTTARSRPSPISSGCPSAIPPPAFTSWSTRTWPPRRACTRSSRATTCAVSPCSRSAGPDRSMPAVSPSCSSPAESCSRSNASVLSAFGTLVTPVRIDLARSMVRPLQTVDRGRARRAARRAPRRRHPRARPRPACCPIRSTSVTGSTPAISVRATRSRCGSARAHTGRPPTPRSCSGSTPTIGASTDSPSPTSESKRSRGDSRRTPT